MTSEAMAAGARAEARAHGLQVVDWFHRTEARRFYSERPARLFQVVVPARATLAEMLAIGYAAGLPKGSARGGCVELQAESGVWTSPSRMTPRNATFEAWDE